RLINHPDLPTPYPAVAELFFRAVMTIDESARAVKAAIVVSDAAIVAVLLLWLSASHRRRWWVLAYAWNPLVMIEGAGNGHVDLLGVLFVVVTASCLARGNRKIAAVTFALGVGVKFLPVILAPLLWRRIRVRDAVVGAAVLAAFYIPFLDQGRLPFGSLGSYLAYWRFNAPVFSALELVLPGAGLIGVAPILGFGTALWARWYFELDSPEAWAWPLAVTLLFAPTIFPWYLVWLTPFLSVSSTVPLAVWTVSVFAVYWSLPAWAATLIEFVPVLCAALWTFALHANPSHKGFEFEKSRA